MVRFVDGGGGDAAIADEDLAPVIELFPGSQPSPVDTPSESAACEAAENQLLRKLRSRSLSVSEARGVLRDHELSDHHVEELIEKFERLSYLDDAALAEHLVYMGAERKGQGRGAIAQTLSKRGIARDVAEEVLGALGDDEAERALEFARSRASRMSSLENDVALRRLHGQLARRGFGGHIAMTAARTALEEVRRTSSGVRFS
ncbi:regulatory protein RecX [Microbacterium sp. NPDC076911]|uniref:regulatory protein RecX n=1 Tax=Microbacterium sp. NPDC076911 TaxID=3154958 RepID=UPI003444C492